MKPADTGVIKLMLQLNPQLMGEGQSTETAVATTKRALAGGAPAKVEERKHTLSERVAELSAQHTHRRAAIKENEAKLRRTQAELVQRAKAARERALQCVVEAMLKLDPDLTAPSTLALLKDENALLQRIGFSPRKLLAAERRR